MSPTVLHTTWQILGSWQKEALDAQICAHVSGSPSAFLAPRTPPARRCRPSPARLHVVLLPRNSSSGQHFLTTTAANVGQISLYNTLQNEAQRHGAEGGVRTGPPPPPPGGGSRRRGTWGCRRHHPLNQRPAG